MNTNNLQELFALPIGTEKVEGFPGPPLYTSDSLKKKYIAAMRKSDKTDVLGNKIEDLVNKELIIPCFLSKGLIRFAIDKMFGNPENKNVLGFYMNETKRIYLLINNNINFFGFANNDWLASLTIHESQHMCAHLKPGSFYSLFRDDLFDFYYDLLTRIFQLKESVDRSSIQKIIRFIYTIELKLSQDNSTLKKYWELLMDLSPYSNLDRNSFEKIVNDYIVIIKIFWKSLSAFMSVSRNYRHILGKIYDSYSNIFNTTTNSICIQELTSISEMVAVLSEKRNKVTNKIYKAFLLI